MVRVHSRVSGVPRLRCRGHRCGWRHPGRPHGRFGSRKRRPFRTLAAVATSVIAPPGVPLRKGRRRGDTGHNTRAPPGPDLGIRPSGPEGAGVARPASEYVRAAARPPIRRDGWFRDRPKSARPRPPLRTESAPLEVGEVPGAMSRGSRRPHPPQWHEPARSQEHPAYGPSRLREHPRRPFCTQTPKEPPHLTGRRGGPHGGLRAVGVETPHHAREGSNPPPDGAVPPGD